MDKNETNCWYHHATRLIFDNQVMIFNLTYGSNSIILIVLEMPEEFTSLHVVLSNALLDRLDVGHFRNELAV